METISYAPIGVVHSPFTALAGMPLQPVAATEVVATVEVLPAFQAGLRDLDGFSHLILLCHLHLMRGHALEVTPFLDTVSHGIFATRSPKRPNAIGLSVVRLLRVEGGTLHLAEVDLVDGTPVLDIKPYVPAFDSREGATSGWFAGNLARVQTTRADDRFS
jgi:tRNA-Thr(GGU) m(6)t(6)A37 methyltransferase TsaA